jgi:hypothetical protein
MTLCVLRVLAETRRNKLHIFILIYTSTVSWNTLRLCINEESWYGTWRRGREGSTIVSCSKRTGFTSWTGDCLSWLVNRGFPQSAQENAKTMPIPMSRLLLLLSYQFIIHSLLILSLCNLRPLERGCSWVSRFFLCNCSSDVNLFPFINSQLDNRTNLLLISCAYYYIFVMEVSTPFLFP